ncbi:MAG: MATE family efflux transporter, partial [Bacteroidales bacterium]|nr:MATE family efflux transporter [Bacteroidales bacterium]
DAATALVGQSVGAGRKELAKRFAWITTGLGMGIMGLLAILMYAIAPQLMQMLSPDTEVISLGARVLRIEAFAELGYAASIVAYGVCVGAGDTKWPSVMNFTSMWIVRILPAIFLVKVYGLVGFWIAMAVELTFRGIIFLVRIARGRWLGAA